MGIGIGLGYVDIAYAKAGTEIKIQIRKKCCGQSRKLPFLKMKTIETCVSPDLLELHELTNKTVIVVDIFRASSTIVTALSNGVNTILPVKDLDQCKAYKKKAG